MSLQVSSSSLSLRKLFIIELIHKSIQSLHPSDIVILYRSDNLLDPPTLRINVTKIYMDSYKPETKENNIALLETSEMLLLDGKKSSTIDLPVKGFDVYSSLVSHVNV